MDDKIAKGLAELVTQLERADELLEDETRDDALRGVVRGALGTARTVLDEARRSVEGASARSLDDQSYSQALESLLEDYGQREGWEADLSWSGDPERLSERLGSGLYAVAREAFSTIAQYTEADEVSVELTVGSDAVELLVSDRGTGFDPASPDEASAGLTQIREQAREIGGEFELESSWTDGTAIVVTVPVE